MRARTLLQTLAAGGIGLALLLAPLGAAGGDKPAEPPAAQRGKSERPPAGPGVPAAEVDPVPPRVVYQPPRRGSPRARVAGAARSASQALPSPLALVPEHVAETISSQPTLFWHIDASPGRNLELVFTVIEEDASEPLIEAVLPAPAGPGIQRIRLADHGVRLRPGVDYEWSVAVIADSGRRGRDLVSSAGIRLVDAPGPFEPGAAGYAAQGLWYDALASASDEAEADPGNPLARGARDALLRQARLEVALH